MNGKTFRFEFGEVAELFSQFHDPRRDRSHRVSRRTGWRLHGTGEQTRGLRAAPGVVRSDWSRRSRLPEET